MTVFVFFYGTNDEYCKREIIKFTGSTDMWRNKQVTCKYLKWDKEHLFPVYVL